jgi:hypothetical protein
MPTVKPRLTVVLPPDVALVLRELAELSGKSQSAVVAELLESASPVFARVVESIKAANAMRESVRRDFAGSLERAQDRIEAELNSLLGEIGAGDLGALGALVAPVSPPAGGLGGDGSPSPAGRPEGGPCVLTPVPLTGGSGRPNVVQRPKRSGLTRTSKGG